MKLNWIFNTEVARHLWKNDFKQQKETKIKLKEFSTMLRNHKAIHVGMIISKTGQYNLCVQTCLEAKSILCSKFTLQWNQTVITQNKYLIRELYTLIN